MYTYTTFSQAKHLQFVSGVDVSSFWMSTFAWDLMNALVPILLSVVLFAAFQVDGYTGDGLAGVFLLLVCAKNLTHIISCHPLIKKQQCMRYDSKKSTGINVPV